MDETTRAQLSTILAVVEALEFADVRAWLFGGWGLDARIGRLTRSHGDIEFWVNRPDAGRATAVLESAGASVVMMQPPQEAEELTWGGVGFSVAYFDRQPDGTFTTRGRWSDWIFPSGSFGETPGVLEGTRVPAMSAAGMLAMKEQFPRLRNGGPWRPKDVQDMETLRRLVADETAPS